MSKSLLDFKVYENNETNLHETVVVEFLAREGDSSTWESTLEALAKSRKRVIFRVDYIDPSGLVVRLISHWFKHAATDTVLVETAVPGIRSMLKLMLEEMVVFTDKE